MRLVPIKYHVLFWIAYNLIYTIMFVKDSIYNIFSIEQITSLIFDIISLAIVFYVTLEILIPLFIKKKIITTFILFLILVIATTYFSYLLYSIRQHFMVNAWIFPLKIDIAISIIFSFVQVVPLAFTYFYIKKILLEEQQKDIIQQQNNQLQQKIIKTQLKALKTKINPEFLDDVLEFFHQEAIKSSKELAKAIELLSQMLNYAIKEDDGNGKVDLAKEVIHIQNFIQIQQLRFSNRLNVQFQIKGSLQNIQIVPLILITFVENAFKHGALENHDNPLYINLTIKNHQLYFVSQNIPRKGPLDKAQGIGLANTKKRLQLAYPNKHNLSITQNDKIYTIQLNVKL